MTAAARLPRAIRNPYRVPRPAVINFSGGRTSAYMLRSIVDAYGGSLPPGIAVIFANTGLERPETLEFVDTCARQLGQSRYVGLSTTGTHRTEPASSTSPPRPGTASPMRH